MEKKRLIICIVIITIVVIVMILNIVFKDQIVELIQNIFGVKTAPPPVKDPQIRFK